MRVERVKRNITLNNWVNVKIEINPGKFLSLLFQIRVLHQLYTHDSDEKAKLASEFNAHFANVAGNIRKRNGIDNVPNNTESIKSSVKHQGFIFSPVTEDEVLKSVGIDDINSFILKASAPVIVKSLTHLINKSLLEGIFPSRWKTAKNCPCLQNG